MGHGGRTLEPLDHVPVESRKFRLPEHHTGCVSDTVTTQRAQRRLGYLKCSFWSEKFMKDQAHLNWSVR